MKRRWWVFVAVTVVFMLGMALLMLPNGDADEWRPWQGSEATRDLSALDTLRVLVIEDPLVWENTPHRDNGLAFQWIQRFAKKNKIPVRAVVCASPDSLLAALWEGRGDVIATPIDGGADWLEHYAVTEPLMDLAPMVARQRPEVGRDEDGAALSIGADSVRLEQGSPFGADGYGFDPSFAQHAPVTNALVLVEDELLVEVVMGKVASCLVSDLRAGHEAARFPALEFEGPVGPVVPWRFVVRRTSTELRTALDSWIADAREREARELLVKAYTGPIPPPGPLRSRRMKGIQRDSISPFDPYFRAHARDFSVDWRLLAAMAWKESRFDSTVTSRKGAMGIMQIMPGTATGLGLDSASAMEDHIRAAAQYFDRLDMIWRRAVPDKEQRLRFVLASYNAGPGHVIDAQRLADHLGLDPARWEGNVERAILLLAKPRYFTRPEMKNGYCKGSQVFHYVRGVLGVYEQLRARTGA